MAQAFWPGLWVVPANLPFVVNSYPTFPQCCIFTALDVTPNDTKALFRKCQALEQLGKMEEAFKDAHRLNQLDPGNGAVQGMLRRLNAVVSEKVRIVLGRDEFSGMPRRQRRRLPPCPMVIAQAWATNKIYYSTSRTLNSRG